MRSRHQRKDEPRLFRPLGPTVWDFTLRWGEAHSFDRRHWDEEPEEYADTKPMTRPSAYWPSGKLRATWANDGIHLYDIAAESVDGPVLVWDVRGDLSKPARPGPAEWNTAWQALGEEGPESAFRAIRSFALHSEGVAELTKRFADLKPPSEETIAALIRKLDDRDYTTREQAGKDLKALGTVAFPSLKKALAGAPSEELRERANKLLAVAMPSDRLRAERVVEAMQLADTDAARKQLAEWAKGPVSDPLTVAVKRATK